MPKSSFRLEKRAAALHPNWPVSLVVELALRDTGSVPRAAQALGVSSNTLRAWIDDNGYEVVIKPYALLRKRGEPGASDK